MTALDLYHCLTWSIVLWYFYIPAFGLEIEAESQRSALSAIHVNRDWLGGVRLAIHCKLPQRRYSTCQGYIHPQFARPPLCCVCRARSHGGFKRTFRRNRQMDLT